MSAHLRKVTRAKQRWQRLCDDGSNEYHAAVQDARAAGHTMHQIGEAAGISRQGVMYLLNQGKDRTDG
jgi:DNA-binding phage protein